MKLLTNDERELAVILVLFIEALKLTHHQKSSHFNFL